MPESAKQGQKLLGLEILRFSAAFAMLLWHYQHFSYVGLRPDAFHLDQQPFYGALAYLYRYGYLGVQVFWCISGYIFFWKYRDSIANREVSPREFFVLRFSRLYPLHLATLLLVAALQIAYYQMNDSYFVVKKNDIPRFVLQLFMASHWGILKGYSFNSPIWSISAEVLVYFFFYIILRRFGPRLLINLVIILACATAKLLGMGSPVFDCFVFFYAGGIAATISRNPILGNKRKLCGGVLLVSLATACWLSISLELYAWRYFHYFFLVVCVPPFLYLLCENIRIPNSARTLIEAAGNMTYSSYLIHFPLQLGVALTYSSLGIKSPMYHPAFFLAFIGSTLSLSFLIYRYFEAPAQRMIRKRMLLASTDRRSAEKRATSP